MLNSVPEPLSEPRQRIGHIKIRWFAFFASTLGILVVSALIAAFVPAMIDSRPLGAWWQALTDDKNSFEQHTLSSSAVQPGKRLQLGQMPATVATGPLRVSSVNPRYFADANGNLVYLTGSHTWLNLVDGTLTDPPATFDYDTWLDFLEEHNHNFFRLWTWEQSWWVVEWHEPYYFTPHPFERTGPGNALDGKSKFDLTKLNQAYFDRMRERIIAAGDRGMYVSIMLFDGWSVAYPKGFYDAGNPWLGHPFNVNNNINSVNGDPNGDNGGSETHTLAVPAVTEIQEAYVRKVIDTVNDLDNVLYEISNESDGDSDAWQYHFIDFIKDYEATKPKQHPVGMTVEWPNGDNSDLFNSSADWISPNGDINNPPLASGDKVIIADTDHLCGICGDRTWVWKSFTRGENPLFMDQYDDLYELEGGGYDLNNPNDVSLRRNLGYTRIYANRINLAAMTPRPDLASTGYALANPVAEGAEYLVYLPNGGMVNVDLSATPDEVNVEWFNPETGEAIPGAAVEGGVGRSFAPPFSGDAVLYLYQTVEEPTYTLTLATVGNGTATAQPDGPYVSGQDITLTATADPGWDFAGWSGGITSSQNPVTFSITGDTTVTATFIEETEPQYTLDIATVGSGVVAREPDQSTYEAGQVVTLTATPDSGWVFAGWSGGASGSDNPTQITITGDTTVTATFTEESTPQYSLDVSIVGSGTVTRAPDQSVYDAGQVVTLTATADSGWTFAGWSGGANGTDNPVQITITADTTVTATFTEEVEPSYQLFVPSVGSGTVTREPDQSSYEAGQVVTLTAMPDSGWQFVGWSGGASGNDNPTQITIIADTTVTATFTEESAPQFTLDVSIVGSGVITREPDQSVYEAGQVVTLTATAEPGWAFAGWSGGITSTENPVSFSISADTIVTATFLEESAPQYTLDVSIAGNGTVTREPDQSIYEAGQVVTLTAVPDSGWQFVGWSGGANGSDNPTPLTISADTVVTATFIEESAPQYTLDINIAGNGAVTREPDQSIYDAGQVVTLTATPATRWMFVEWSGAMSGVENPKPVTISADTLITATFEHKPNVSPLLSLTKTTLVYWYRPSIIAPAGILQINATLINSSSAEIRDMHVRVSRLTRGNVVLNAMGGPGGTGAIIPIRPESLGADGVLQPGESVKITFHIGLRSLRTFIFEGDVFGVAEGIATSAADVAGLELEISEEEIESVRQNSSLYLPNVGG